MSAHLAVGVGARVGTYDGPAVDVARLLVRIAAEEPSDGVAHPD